MEPSPEVALPAGPPRDGFRLAILTLMLGAGTFLTIGVFTQLVHIAYGLWFSEVVLFFGVPWLLLRRAGRDPVAATGLSRFSWPSVGLGALLGLANMAGLVVPLQFMAQSLAPDWLKDMFDGSQIFMNQRPPELGALLLGVALAAPFCEEFFFRGVVQRGLGHSFRSLLITSALFSAFHVDPVGFLSRVELGLLFGFLFLRTGSIWPGIAAHFANNALASGILVASLGQPKQTPQLSEVLPVTGLGLLALFGLWSLVKKYPHLLPIRPPPEAEVREPRPSFGKIFWPFAVAATVGFLPLLAFDARGLQLNVQEPFAPLPKPADDDTAEWKAAHLELRQLRNDARDGRIPVRTYLERRKALSDQWRKERLSDVMNQMKR